LKVKFTAEARSDIASIYRYLDEQAGNRIAKTILAELRERCLGLARMPERFERLEGLEGLETAGLRRRVYRNYLIVYRIQIDGLEIVRVFHGASDYLKLLNNEADF
jgi:toxin ParE1/3/4